MRLAQRRLKRLRHARRLRRGPYDAEKAAVVGELIGLHGAHAALANKRLGVVVGQKAQKTT